MELFGNILSFLEENEDISPASRTKLLAIPCDSQRKAYLLVEMAITVDAGKVFVQMTYDLEDDEPLMLQCYEKLETVTRSI